MKDKEWKVSQSTTQGNSALIIQFHTLHNIFHHSRTAPASTPTTPAADPTKAKFVGMAPEPWEEVEVAD